MAADAHRRKFRKSAGRIYILNSGERRRTRCWRSERELGSNILHLETPEIQPMRTASAAPAPRHGGQGEEGSQKYPSL
jgi:hypothetical protein